MKKVLSVFFILVMVLSFASMSSAAESFNAYVVRVQNSAKLVDIVLEWTTKSDGSFIARALSGYDPMKTGYPVYVQYIMTDPVNTPTDNYDLSFVSSDLPGSVDIFGQAAYDRDQTNSEIVEPSVNYISVDLNKVTFDVLNAGNDKSGVVRLRCILAD